MVRTFFLFTKGRVSDLSRAAARALGMLESGVCRVRMELLSPRPNLHGFAG